MSQPHDHPPSSPYSRPSLESLYLFALSTLTPRTIPHTIRTLTSILHTLPRSKSTDPEISSALEASIPPATEVSIVYTTLALLRSHLGEFWLAKHTFVKALSYNRSNTLARYCLGICMFEQGEYMGAEKQFNRCLGAIGEGSGMSVSVGCWGKDGEVRGKWRLQKEDVTWNILASYNSRKQKTHPLSEGVSPWGVNGIPATLIFSIVLPSEVLPLLLQSLESDRASIPTNRFPTIGGKEPTPPFSAAFNTTWSVVSRTKPLPPLPPPTPFAKPPVDGQTTDNGKEESWCSSFSAPTSPPKIPARAISPSFAEIRAGPPDLVNREESEAGKPQDKEKKTNGETAYGNARENSQPNRNNTIYSRLPFGTLPSHRESNENDEDYDLEIALLPHERPPSPSGSITSILTLYSRTPSTNPLPSSTLTQTPPTTTSIGRHPDMPTITTAAKQPTHPSNKNPEPNRQAKQPILTFPLSSFSPTAPTPPPSIPLPPLPPPHRKPILTLSTAAAAPFRPPPASELMRRDFAFLPLTRSVAEIRAQALESQRDGEASMRGLGISVAADPALFEGLRDGKGLGADGGEILLPRTFEGFGPRKK